MNHNWQDLKCRLEHTRERLALAEQRAGRPAGSVRLIAVSKTRPAGMIRACAELGQRAFGESYVQEAVEKVQALAALGLEWHFIGPLQSNKTRLVAARFDWVHSVDRLKIAQRLNEQRPEEYPPLNICLQVNVSGEARKSGVTPDALPELAAAVAELPRLRLRGLMTIPAWTEDPLRQRQPFRRLREYGEELRAAGLLLEELSMGMSGDLEAAVAEGATLVRVGTDIFGART